MDEIPEIEPPAWMIESMERGRADVAAGRFGTSEDVLREIFESIEELETEQNLDNPVQRKL